MAMAAEGPPVRAPLPPAGPGEWSLVVSHDPRGARVGRQRFAASIAPLVPAALLGDAVAIVAELLGNAVAHANPLPGGVVELSWRVDPPTIRVQVADGGSADAPSVLDASPDAVGGRGLAIVTALARRWGVEHDGATQCVWAEL
jgi:anti-sigma regulatory factor (Ser/Thr protein kinase)